MHVQTIFLQLCEPAYLGERIDDWRVSWVGGWDKCRVFFVVMVEREYEPLHNAPVSLGWRSAFLIAQRKPGPSLSNDGCSSLGHRVVLVA
jgi:hypothetical protein